VLRAVSVAQPDADVLVVDDASPDGTGELLDRLASESRQLRVVHRPSRMGIGSAHKLAILYARLEGYDRLVTVSGSGRTTGATVTALVDALDDADLAVQAPDTPRRGSTHLLDTVTSGLVGRDADGYASLVRGYARPLIEMLDVDAIGADGPAFAVESLAAIAAVTTRWRLLAAPADAHGSRGARAGAALEGVARALGARLRPGHTEASRAPETHDVACRICGGRWHVQMHPAKEEGQRALADVSPYSCASHSGRTHGEILRCLGCGIVFMKPKLTPEALVGEYANVVDPVYLDNLPARLTTFNRTLDKIRPILGERARVLEVGSYCGAFLRIARERGLDVVGIEPSAWATEQARKITDAPIHQGTLDDVPRGLAPFDAVVAWDVVEHFADPVGELRKINRLLPMGGRFFFCTLMIDNWFPRLVGGHWPWYMDMHLFYFTEATIRDLLRRSGFVLVESSPYRHITTVEYLLRKLGTLGIPGASPVSRLASKTPWGKAQIPVRLGDIQLFSCTKIAEVASDDRAEARREIEDRPSDVPSLLN
jgi:SAM-dependent methyltransferase